MDSRGLLAGFVALKLLLHLPILTRYGFHHDELYFIACGAHPAWGYVDHPPLVPALARLATTLFGESLFGLRILATLAGAATVLLTGLLARRLGGGRFAQAVACLAVLVAPVFLRTGNLLCIPAFEPLFWLGGSYLIVRIAEGGSPRLWLWLGLLAGVGLLNKHSMLFFGLGLAVGVLVTPLRRHLRTPWPYAGGALALAILLPNLVWQAAHDWPTVGFLRGLNESVLAGIDKVQFLAGQLLYLNPLAAIVWIAGLVFCFSAAGRRYRILGWIWLVVFLLLLVVQSKIYYLAPAYPALLAAGGVELERRTARPRHGALRPAIVAVLVVGGLALLPLSLPVLPIDATDRYARAVTFGAFENIYEITGDLHGMFGWPERVEAVGQAFHELPEVERGRVVIFVAGYGTAGAIDLFGARLGLPQATSLAQTYWLWGLPDRPIDTVLAAGWSVETLERIFAEVEVVRRIRIEHADPGEAEFLVAVCRAPKSDLHALWGKNRPW